MDFLELLKTRRSVRKYTDEQVAEDDLERILLAANASPVGSSRFEDVHLTVVRDRAVLDALAEAVQARFADKETIDKIIGTVSGDEVPRRGKQDPFYHAPVVVFVSHRKQDLQPGIEWANAACVAYSMHLEATSLGLASCFMWGALESARVIPEHDNTSLLQLPEDFEPLIGVAIGHTAADVPARNLVPDKLGVNYL